jgi:putative membrane protein insertion efficiency factor
VTSDTPHPERETEQIEPGPRDSGADGESSVRRIIGRAGRLAARPLIWLIRAYQLVISPLTPPSCRYYPSCSAYALTAIQRFGPLKGTWLAVRRLLRCHPWSPGGVDHVPERSSSRALKAPTTGSSSAERTPDHHHH